MVAYPVIVNSLPVVSVKLKCDRAPPFVIQKDGAILFAATLQRDMAGVSSFCNRRLVVISRKNKTIKVFGEFICMGLLREGENAPSGNGVLLHRIGERMQFTLFSPIDEREAAKLKRKLNRREHD